MKTKYKRLAYLAFWIGSIGVCIYLNKQMIPANLDKEMKNAKEVIFTVNDIYAKTNRYTEDIYREDFTSLAELYEASDIVIKAKPITKVQKSQLMQTSVKVNEVIQGTLEEDEITVIEQASMIAGSRLFITGSVLPMSYDKEYILFLTKNMDYASGTVYRLTSLSYGKFPTEGDLRIYEDEYPIFREDGSSGYLSDVQNYDVAFLDLKDIKSYESGEIPMEDEYSKMNYESLLIYRDVFQKTYVEFYEQLMQKIDV